MVTGCYLGRVSNSGPHFPSQEGRCRRAGKELLPIRTLDGCTTLSRQSNVLGFLGGALFVHHLLRPPISLRSDPGRCTIKRESAPFGFLFTLCLFWDSRPEVFWRSWPWLPSLWRSRPGEGPTPVSAALLRAHLDLCVQPWSLRSRRGAEELDVAGRSGETTETGRLKPHKHRQRLWEGETWQLCTPHRGSVVVLYGG